MLKQVTLVLMAVALLAWSVWAREGQWTGFITDSHCKKVGANSHHTAESFVKCLKGGAKPMIFTDGGETFILGASPKLEDFVGKHVRITGTLDEAKKTLSLDTIVVAD